MPFIEQQPAPVVGERTALQSCRARYPARWPDVLVRGTTRRTRRPGGLIRGHFTPPGGGRGSCGLQCASCYPFAAFSCAAPTRSATAPATQMRGAASTATRFLSDDEPWSAWRRAKVQASHVRSRRTESAQDRVRRPTSDARPFTRTMKTKGRTKSRFSIPSESLRPLT